MTRYSDNIYSGFQGLTSAGSSKSIVTLCKGPYAFNSTTGSTTLSGTLPPGAQGLTARIYITQQASATASDKITVSAGGTDLITVTAFGSASGTANDTKVGVATFTYVASACATPPVPSGANNGGEIPFSVTYLKSSANKTGSCQLLLYFNRADSNTLGVTS